MINHWEDPVFQSCFLWLKANFYFCEGVIIHSIYNHMPPYGEKGKQRMTLCKNTGSLWLQLLMLFKQTNMGSMVNSKQALTGMYPMVVKDNGEDGTSILHPCYWMWIDGNKYGITSRCWLFIIATGVPKIQQSRTTARAEQKRAESWICTFTHVFIEFISSGREIFSKMPPEGLWTLVYEDQFHFYIQ